MSGNIPLLPIEEDCNFKKLGNISWAVLPETNQAKYNYISTKEVSVQLNAENETSYYILDGEVTFYIQEGNTYNEITAGANKTVTIPQNTEYYYKTNKPLKMIERKRKNRKQELENEESEKPIKK